MNQRGLIGLCLIALALPLLITPVLPLIDFYNHIARFYVLSHIDSDPVLARNYAAHWQLVPNLGLDVLGAMLLDFVPPLLAAKLIAGTILLVQFTGLLALNRALGSKSQLPAALLGTALLYSYILNWGFANFLLAIGLAFWAMALWFRLRARPLVAAAVGWACAIVIFFAHGFGFALYGIMLAALEFGRWWERKGSVRELLTGLGLLASQAIVPALLFVMSATGGSKGGALPFGQISAHIGSGTLGNRLATEFTHRLETIFRVAESPFPAIDVFLVVSAALVVLVGLRMGVLRLRKSVLPAMLVLALLTLITPPSIFNVGFVADRLPYLFVLVTLAGLDLGAAAAAGKTLILGLLGALAVLRTLVVLIGWYPFGADYRAVETLLATVPSHAVVSGFSVLEGGRRDGGLQRCQMYPPLALLSNDLLTPLFADPTQQPLALKGRVAQAAKARPPLPKWTDDGSYSDDAVLDDLLSAPSIDYILLCGRERLKQALPANVRRRDLGRFTLIELHPAKN